MLVGQGGVTAGWLDCPCRRWQKMESLCGRRWNPYDCIPQQEGEAASPLVGQPAASWVGINMQCGCKVQQIDDVRDGLTILQMDKELLEQSDYAAIVSNQIAILDQLERTNATITAANELSHRFLPEAQANFRKGIETIARIRSNLDEVHKALTAISKAKAASVVP